MPFEYKPIQIVSKNETTQNIELKLDELHRLLDQDDINDCNLVVISICGAIKKGKNSMFNFFLRYLNEVYVNRNFEDWLYNGYDGLKNGFECKNDTTCYTVGIWAWSKIFTTYRKNEEKIGILLLNTQGTFDSESSQHDNVKIFSLASMMSSLQIYNLSEHIQETDIENLQLYTEFGKLMRDQTFQSLVFLVQDRQNSFEYPYGFEGGKMYLEKCLQIKITRPDKLNNLLVHIRSNYKQLRCCVFPMLGMNAKTNLNFNGALSEIDPTYLEILNVFVPKILHPSNVLTKKINGQNIRAKEFTSYLREYHQLLSTSAEIPMAQNIFEVGFFMYIQYTYIILGKRLLRSDLNKYTCT